MEEKYKENDKNNRDIEKNTPEVSSVIENQHLSDYFSVDGTSTRGLSTMPSHRISAILRSSLRLSAPRKKTSISSARSLTEPSSPNLAAVPQILPVKRLSSTLSTSSFSCPFCRICHDSSTDETVGRLIAPCLCDGSLKYVHENCVQRWITISNTKKCELCHFEYETHTYTKPFKDWRCCPLSLGELRNILCFTLMYFMIQTSVAWALYALITNLTQPGMPLNQYAWQFWLKLFVILIGISCVGVFAYVQIRYCFGMCKRWYRINRVCIIQEPSRETIMKLRSEIRASMPYEEDGLYTSLP